jgi:hypothetical protein
MDFKIIDTANCVTGKKILLDAEFTIVILYYYQTLKTKALREFTDGPTGRPANNPSNFAELGDIY